MDEEKVKLLGERALKRQEIQFEKRDSAKHKINAQMSPQPLSSKRQSVMVEYIMCFL